MINKDGVANLSSSYTDPRLDWLSDLPSNWLQLPLKRIVETKITDGPHETPEILDDGIPFLSAEAIKNNKINFERKRGFISPELHKLYSKKCLPQRSDIFMVKSGATTGAVAIVETDAEFNIWSPLALIRVNSKIGAPYYVLYAMLSTGFQRNVALSWNYGTQQNIGMGVIENLRVPIPPLAEQNAIVEFLDREVAKIDALIAKKGRHIDLLEERRAALICQAVTKGLDTNVSMKDSGADWLGKIPSRWEAKKIKRLCQVKRGASPRPIDDPIYFDDVGEYAWVRISDVTASERYLLTTEQKLSKLGESKSVRMEPGDLFLSIAATVGKPMITKIKCCIHDGFVYFSNLKQDKEYMFYLFQSGEMYKGLGKLGTQLNLNTDTIGNIIIPVPPIREQQTIVKYLDDKVSQINLTIGLTKKQIEKLHEYRISLITMAVTGKIDVRSYQNHNVQEPLQV